MSLIWLQRFVQRTHALLPSALFAASMALLFSGFVYFSEGGLVRGFTSEAQFFGTIVLFVLLPSYLLAMVVYIWRGTENALLKLEPLVLRTNVACTDALHQVRSGLTRLHPFSWFFIVLGVVLGVYQSSRHTVATLFATGQLNLMDAGYLFGNIVVWTCAVMLACWRIPQSLAFLKMGRLLDVDLYRLDLAQPLTRMATIDLLTIAGGMSFMALQSLDAEFRLSNYVAGIAIGLPVGLVLMGLPLWGLHQKILQLKADRLSELQSRMAVVLDCPDPDLVHLEALCGHIARIRAMSNWPINMALLARIFAYGVIPPIAWVGAALVENVVDSW